MLDIETAKTAAAEADAAVSALESRAKDIEQALADADGEHHEARAAVARAIADGADGKSRSALVTAEQKASAMLGALKAGADEVAARLVHARQRQAEARQALKDAEERAAYAASAAALEKFTRKFTEALGDLIAGASRRHVPDIVDRLRTAVEFMPKVHRVESTLDELITHYRRRAGHEQATAVAAMTGAPHEANTGVFLVKDIRYTDADGTIREFPAGWVGNAPAEVVRRAAAAGIGQPLKPRKGFSTVRMTERIIDGVDGTERVFEAGLVLSLPTTTAEAFINRAAAVPVGALSADDIAWWRARPGELPPTFANALFVSSRTVAPPVDLGRLEPIAAPMKEVA